MGGRRGTEVDAFETERPRLLALATRMLGDPAEAEDVVQQAWLRLARAADPVNSLPAWLTTVTSRLCLDRLKSRTPQSHGEITDEQLVEGPPIGAGVSTTPSDPADHAALTDAVGAARAGDFTRLLTLLAPDAVVRADEAAVEVGTPQRIDGRDDVAAFFNGAAHAALPVFVADAPGSAWFDRGEAKVLFDFAVADGLVQAITFRADPETLTRVVRRDGGTPRP